MILFFAPALLSLVVIGCIYLNDNLNPWRR
jgi:hypothetical protein